MRELTKLLGTALIASAASVATVKLLDPRPVLAAPASEALPPDFQKDARLEWTTLESGGGGKILSTHGEWVQLGTPEGDSFWIHFKRPGTMFSVRKPK